MDETLPWMWSFAHECLGWELVLVTRFDNSIGIRRVRRIGNDLFVNDFRGLEILLTGGETKRRIIKSWKPLTPITKRWFDGEMWWKDG